VTRALVGRLLVASITVATIAACNGGDRGDRTVGPDVWCAQLDDAISASAQFDAMDRDDPGRDDASAQMHDELAVLANLDPPADLTDEWAVVSTPPPTNDGGGVQLDRQRTEAGQRIAAWALQNCQLGTDSRHELERRRHG
jgi:hypothetical protein